MRFAHLTTRALVSSVIGNVLDEEPVTSPNPGAVLARQSCEIGMTPCGTGCMDLGNTCCAE